MDELIQTPAPKAGARTKTNQGITETGNALIIYVEI